eukprot:366502-Chlamydomonas_euryale.AAC.3
MQQLELRGSTAVGVSGTGAGANQDSTRAAVGVAAADSPGEGYTMAVLRQHVDWALADFFRFMVGWGMWGATGWAERRVRDVLARGV